MRVFFPRLDPELRRLLEPRLAPGIEVSTGSDAPADYEVLVAGLPDREQMERAASLRRLVVPFAGVPRRTLELAREFPHVALFNLHHNAAPTAECAVALLLAAAKEILPLDASMRRGDWTPRYAHGGGVLLAGKSALVLGYGAIGRRVGRALEALDMTVLGVGRKEAGRLHELLPKSFAVVVCLPETDETRGLLGARELGLLPKGAILVNVGRGPVVDEDALYEALQNGDLGAAGLDVWYRYPESEDERDKTAPANRPFWELSNVVLSPHRAGMARGTEELRARDLAALLNGFARGAEIQDPVDKGLGY